MELDLVDRPVGGTNRYLNNERTRYVHLINGGVSDNALRGAGGTMQTIAQAPRRWRCQRLNRIRRVLVLSIDGRNWDTSVAQRQIVGGIFPSSVWSPAPRSTGSTSKH
jgi:hypothetical protein